MENIKKDKNEDINNEGINNIDFKITNVLLKGSNSSLIINIKSKTLILKNYKKKLFNHFKAKFPELEIDLNFIYDIPGNNKEKIDFYKPKILELIRNEIKSSESWIDSLNIELVDGFLNIYPPNEMAIYMMERNGLKKELASKISKELEINLGVKILESNIKKSKDYLATKAIEEKDIAKHVMTLEPRIVDKSYKVNKNYRFGKNINMEKIKINDINLQTGNCCIEGFVFDVDSRDIRNNKKLITFFVTDLEDSMEVKIFLAEDKAGDFLANVKQDAYVKLSGNVVYDDFSRGIVIMLQSLNMLEAEKREDLSDEKRVELHLHTKMSSMDAITDISKLLERAEDWGHKAVAITDHGVVQGFPEALNSEKNSDVKVIYGLEGYMVNDKKDVLINYNSKKDYNSYVVFDIETTGLSAINDMITEIGALKIVDGDIVDSYSQLINPERPIPEFITKLTGITDEMVKDKPTIKDVIGDFYEFIDNSILVAHNSTFDIGFIREKIKLIDVELNNPVIDTLELSRAVFSELKNHKLNTLAKHLSVNLDNHHRAVDDAKATAEIFMRILELVDIKDLSKISEINLLNAGNDSIKDRPFHVVILAKNLIGLKNLYNIVSRSHMDYFHRQPRIPKSFLEENREGLLISSACSSGELYQAILNNKSDDEIRNIVKFYDYLEIQPLENNDYLLREEILKDKEQLENINRKIYKLGKNNNKPVVATGDVHFLDPEDEVYRRILMGGQGFKDADEQPPLYFKTTDEMLKDFSYLGEKIAKEVVVTNTNLISDLVEDIKPIPDGTYAPVIEGSDEDLRETTYKKAYELYGNPLPEIVENRLEVELNSIIENGYAVMYIISQKLVWKSIEDGYLVGSRGSVGSSFAATMSGITEINPLVPHYLCPECKKSEFFENGEIASGADLPDKKCDCGANYIKDGHDIPFEVFLGFDGDKEPDIDLNFASEYQSNAHKYTENLFGKDYVFRAGTIGTIAERTAYGFVKKYFEAKEERVNNGEINRLVQGCTGIRRTSGQHPGGVMIVPHYKDILDFTPIQYPANDSKSGVVTTHFDYNAISSNILKLDILGHDVPTIIKMLEDMTGVISTDISLDEKETMKLFSSTESLGINSKDINCKVGTLGIPEFGTRFVRQMLVDTEPTTFSELVRISGLSHGTDVWLNNAQDLVRQGIAPLAKVISTREDIMLSLINAGMDKSKSFNIMENVRRGKGLTTEEEREMRSLGIEEWYIDSCKKIKYMFPKAHAAAYVMMSFRIAYYKVYFPEAFYATYFTTKASDFDADIVVKGIDHIKSEIVRLESLGYDATAKDKNLLTVLEVALEMYARGYKIQKVDLYKSDSDEFIIHEDGILPPLKCLEGLGQNAAKNIVEEREKGPFISREDLTTRAGVSRPAIEVLCSHGCLEDLPDSNQIDLFSI